MKDIWHTTAVEILGESTPMKPKPWVSNESEELAKKKREARKKNDQHRYKKLRAELQRSLRSDKNNWLDQECSKIDEYDKAQQSRKLYRQIKKINNPSHKPKQMAINDKRGTTLTDPAEILNRWKEYGEELFQKDPNENETQSMNFTNIEIEPAPLISEIESSIKDLHTHRAPGLDNIPAELVKVSGPMATKTIHALCVKIWETGQWPKEWKEQEIVMLYKSGNSKECGNYRTIALISHTSKILLKIILNRMKKKISEELPEEQAGFRQHRGTADMICVLQVMIEKLIENKESAFITFIDYSKAFDSVSHNQMFTIMIQMGFPTHLVYLIQNLYVNQQAKIRWNNSHSELFGIRRGVRQGCILSPNLFSIYTEMVMREAEVEHLGIPVGGRRLSNLRYADDTALCATTHEDADELINKVNEAGIKRLLKLNVKKTKLMVINGHGEPPLCVRQEPIEQVANFKYLGATKTDKGDCSKDISARIAIGKRRMLDLNNIWKNRSIPTTLKVKLIKTLIWPVMIYGTEGWTLRKKDERKIRSAEMWCYRRLLRVSWTEHRTDANILQQLGERRSLLELVIRRKLTYFGHACRHSECGLMKLVFQGKVNGKRGRGRPQTNYTSNVMQWMGLPAAGVYQLAQDRHRWRQSSLRAARAASIRHDEAG